MASSDSIDDLTGIVGFAADLIDAMGEWGVGLFTLLETVFPPIPSEVILPLAGFISSQGSMNIVLVVATSTLGAYLGGALLYLLGAKVGLERGIRLLAKLPLVDRDDFEKAASWFDRHGKSAVFFGRLVPGVRSVVSLPAGAGGMNFALFSGLTIAGSAVWNGILITLGSLLGEQYELVSRYSSWLNYAVYLGFGSFLVFLVVRHLKRRRAKRSS
ncbi:membrane protein DedA with SNARE-associated domain [Mycetocola sp. CAN_C7]|uniref:DedA family protein n=1 Tax=Mycetocola sp. CAN_C7 TaxID=2787724 RepID=UPI0018C9DE52